MRCQFESYPSPQIQWIKLSRTVQDPEGRILAVDIDNGVNDITIRQIGPISYESILSVSYGDRRKIEAIEFSDLVYTYRTRFWFEF